MKGFQNGKRVQWITHQNVFKNYNIKMLSVKVIYLKENEKFKICHFYYKCNKLKKIKFI